MIFGLPPLLVYAILAGLGADIGLKGLEAYQGYSLGKKQIAAGERTALLQAAMGRKEEKRTDKLIQQLLAHTTEEKSQSRELEMLRMLLGSAEGSQNTMMTLMGAAANRPRPSYFAPPSTSLANLMR